MQIKWKLGLGKIPAHKILAFSEPDWVFSVILLRRYNHSTTALLLCRTTCVLEYTLPNLTWYSRSLYKCKMQPNQHQGQSTFPFPTVMVPTFMATPGAPHFHLQLMYHQYSQHICPTFRCFLIALVIKMLSSISFRINLGNAVALMLRECHLFLVCWLHCLSA